MAEPFCNRVTPMTRGKDDSIAGHNMDAERWSYIPGTMDALMYEKGFCEEETDILDWLAPPKFRESKR